MKSTIQRDKPRRSQGAPRGPWLPLRFFENIVILCFERRFSKQNSVIRLKSNILAPKKIFGSLQILWLAMPLERKHVEV